MLASKGLMASSAVAPIYVDDVFSTYLYTGNGSTQTITNGIDLAGEGGLIWNKIRNLNDSHFFTDTVRGNTQVIFSDLTNGNSTFNNMVSSFNSDGFNIGNRNNGYNNVAWTFRKQPKFFDVVTYTGDGVAGKTIAHNLGSVPGMIIVKRTDTTGAWQVYHRSLANTEYMVLDTSAAKATGATRWNSTTPTSTVFSLGTDSTVNASGGTYVAYLFAHDAGGFGESGTDNIVSCGSFNSTGFVNLGWEPQFVLMKSTTETAPDPRGSWRILDNMRGIVPGDDAHLLANSSEAEQSASFTTAIRLEATGFTVESQGNYGTSTIYLAIRRPNKPPTSGTEVFSPSTSTQSSGALVFSGFPVDMYLTATRTASPSGYGVEAKDRLRGSPFLATSKTSAEADSGAFSFDYSTGVTPGRFSNSPITLMFRRAPGFFDVVCYTGNATAARGITHNLTVAPEMIIVKSRSISDSWPVWATSVAFGTNLYLNNTNAVSFGDTDVLNYNEITNTPVPPTTTTFTVGTQARVNASGSTYVAYLFATLPGISKVGNYTGTGTTLQINCGFTTGARFVLIKRTDSTGSWYVWDTARGIIAGNDPYLLLNSTAAEVTNTDYIDPLASGFEISSTAPAEINASGGSYIFLAIA